MKTWGPMLTHASWSQDAQQKPEEQIDASWSQDAQQKQEGLILLSALQMTKCVLLQAKNMLSELGKSRE